MASGYDGHINKRQRTDDMRSDREDRLKPDPSAVVHVRNVPDGANESDMMHSLQQFGSIVYVLMMPARRQALVEFQDLESAKTCVSYAQHNPIYVRGQVSLFNYSTSQRIQRSQGDHVSNLPPNHILLFTVMKPDYPITCEVMHAICSPYGEIQRMVIFKKHGVQAMVEFDNVHSAKRAKEKLHGCDIYSGCCTLKVDFAKPTKLNVVRNDPEHSWDYTNPNLGDGKLALLGQGKDMSAPPRSAPLLQAPAGYGPRPTPYGGAPQDPGMGASPANSGGYGMYEQEGYGGYGSPPQRSPYDSPDRYGAQKPVPGMDRGPYGRGPSYEGQHGGPLVHNAPAPGPSSGAMIQGAVLMVYGLNMQKMNADRVFNLFCLYGNVVRVKFLKSKEGSAMVQMGDSLAVERCMQLLNGVIFFKQKMQLGVSKQAFLQDVNNPHDLPDGSQSFKDFMGNRNNRFANPEAASKNRIQPPTKVLHYFNAPPSLTEDEIMAMLESLDAPKPVKIKLFPSKTERSSSGLMEFSTKADSIEALILANHHSLENPSGKAPYVFKLCFSGTPIMYQ